MPRGVWGLVAAGQGYEREEECWVLLGAATDLADGVDGRRGEMVERWWYRESRRRRVLCCKGVLSTM